MEDLVKEYNREDEVIYDAPERKCKEVYFGKISTTHSLAIVVFVGMIVVPLVISLFYGYGYFRIPVLNERVVIFYIVFMLYIIFVISILDRLLFYLFIRIFGKKVNSILMGMKNDIGSTFGAPHKILFLKLDTGNGEEIIAYRSRHARLLFDKGMKIKIYNYKDYFLIPGFYHFQ